MGDGGRFGIAGGTAFVTGAASGIGLAIARSLLAAGARVAAADINRDALDEAFAEYGDAALPIVLDVTDRAAWPGVHSEVERALGPVSILVNNAGIGPDLNPLDEMPAEAFDLLLAIKLTGTFNGIHTFVPGMRERGSGHVVNTASMAGLNASPRLGAYTAAMFGIVGMSEVLRAELAAAGVGVSVLCPGLVATNLGETTDRAGIVRRSAKVSRGTGLAPEVVGDLVVEGIRENRPYLITHGEYRDVVARRHDAIIAAFDAAAKVGDAPTRVAAPASIAS